MRFHVAESGEGPPLVLLHGWPQHWWMWRKVLPSLGREFRCIAPDLRGLGWSDAPREGYAKQELADDVLALLDALGLERVRLLGHDWGAVASGLVCVQAPERIVRCLMLSVPLPWEPGLDPRRVLGVAHMPLLSAPYAERIVPAVADRVLRISGFPAQEIETYVRVLRAPERRRATVGLYRTFLTRELAPLVARPPRRPEVPVRAVGGTADPIVRWSRGVEKVRGGHFLPEQSPDAVIGHALGFL